MSETDWLTVPEMAAVLRISKDTAYSLISEGRVPHIRIGRAIRVPRESLVLHLQREAEGAAVTGAVA